MKRTICKSLLLSIFLLIGLPTLAQKVKSVSAEYTYVTPPEKSVAEAKRIALERARLQALADEFGTTVSQTNATHIKNSSSGSSLDFLSIGSSEVKGEWLEDTKEPQYEINFTDDNLIVKVTVSGKAREIVSASVDIEVSLLRNGKEKKYESLDFKNGDDFYLLFKAPIAGYVAVYLADDTKTAYCLLPYSGDADGTQEVEAGKEYLFFDADKAENEQERTLIDEMTMTCSKSVEHNEIFVVFSSQPFIKAVDEQKDERLPRSLALDDFQRWLAKNRTKDQKMVVVNKLIKVTN